MWTNYHVVAADNLLERKDKLSIEAPSVTCFGLVTCRVKVWHLETGCVPLEDNFKITVTKAEVRFIKLEFYLQNYTSAKL
jgi:hypothetical protein